MDIAELFQNGQSTGCAASSEISFSWWQGFN